ncbi:addiction module protein [Ornithinimicrobium faecis]|uniref:Addiction module protein n=1 Tax=Ornithinimicrobium faecis TaxID=2934158 RepID=A0ABY4YT92_9MICO|nr:addiction module protein [Ornithinimicrobium sp. HY1793]USQ79949.1 addiction module protein [Ornithinimicrobium sp. HY1793]
MVTPGLKATIDRLSDAERRDLLHYLEQTVDDDFALTEDQMAELERRDADLVNGIVEPLTVEQLMQRVTSELR